MSAILCAVWVLYTVWLGFVIRTMVLQWAVVERGHVVRIASCILLDLLVASQSIFVFWCVAAQKLLLWTHFLPFGRKFIFGTLLSASSSHLMASKAPNPECAVCVGGRAGITLSAMGKQHFRTRLMRLSTTSFRTCWNGTV